MDEKNGKYVVMFESVEIEAKVKNNEKNNFFIFINQLYYFI